MSNIRFSER